MSECNQIKEGMAIIVIGKLNEIRKGTIKTVYEDLGYAVVDFGNDVLEKVPFNEIGILPETEAVDENKPEEPVKNESEDGAKVITRDQFMDMVSYVTSPEYLVDKMKMNCKSAFIQGLAVICVAGYICKKLFGENEEVEITKKDLQEIVKENCRPLELIKAVNGKMSIDQVFPISMVSATLLITAVKKLFEDSGEND